MSKSVTYTMWAGSEESFKQYQAHEALTLERMARNTDYAVSGDRSNTEKLPYLLEISNSVGVVNVVGSLTNRDSWFNQFMGVASYQAIREALVYAAESSEVSEIVLNINSGGGPVNGVSDTARLVGLINDKIKPVTAYTDGGMLSAAYWLAAAAGSIQASSTAAVGSIGILAVHQENSQMQKEIGVTTTVVRAGKYKALANPNEPLTDEAKAEIQSQLDEVYKVFVSHVADARGQPYDVVDTTMAQGREFIGEQALMAGLVDGISAYDEVLTTIENKTLDNSRGVLQTPRNYTLGDTVMTKKVLTAADIAVLAAGGSATAAAGESQVLGTGAADVSSAGLEVVGEVTKTTEGTDIISFLKSQIAEKDAALVASAATCAVLQAKLGEQDANFTSLLAIAAGASNNMRVALGGSALDMSAMSATAVLSEHARLAEQFQTKFTAGGVAAVVAPEEVAATTAQDHLMHLRVASFNTQAN